MPSDTKELSRSCQERQVVSNAWSLVNSKGISCSGIDLNAWLSRMLSTRHLKSTWPLLRHCFSFS